VLGLLLRDIGAAVWGTGHMRRRLARVIFSSVHFELYPVQSDSDCVCVCVCVWLPQALCILLQQLLQSSRPLAPNPRDDTGYIGLEGESSRRSAGAYAQRGMS